MKNHRVIQMILSFCCLLSSSLFAEASSDCQNELSQINEEIIYLEEVKTRYLALVLIHEEQAMRWQFDPHLKQEARRSLKLADSERRVLQEIQERIDRLCIRKDQLLKSS
ncbi:MAG: hypothetical protein C5B45_00820 [Chlamydiae bacterium]|nr:MAG: hypothetical protein C5B45_00820 [Chlamydiota bacterium]